MPFNEHFPHRGRIEVICGSMFSGKTEELIRRLLRAEIARQRVLVVKPALDTRYSHTEVVTHNGRALQAVVARSSSDIPALAANFEVIGVDEAQFFDDELTNVAQQLADAGKRVILAGLDMDFRMRPFGPMPQLMAVAEDVTKVHAICTRCGGLAQVSHRLVEGEGQVMLGELREYEALCRHCFREAMRPDEA